MVLARDGRLLGLFVCHAGVLPVRLQAPAFLLACMLSAGTLHGQGCSACKDGVAGAPAKTQQGFRRAIPVLAVPAAGLFAGILLVSRRAGKTREL